MVGETSFPDQARMTAERQAAAQAIARQNVSIQNVNAARAEAERHAARDSFTTIPTAAGQFAIGRQNQIGYNAPTVNFRGLTPNGNPSPVQTAMSPSPAFQPNIVINAQQLPASTSKVDTSRIFLSGRK